VLAATGQRVEGNLNSTLNTQDPKLAIGILGGTFDPIHHGHLRPAQEALQKLALTEVRFVPGGHPPHRPAPVATSAQRLAMVELAIRGVPDFRVDDRELRRAGPSYTVLTLESLRAELGGVPLCLLIGMDQFRGFESWHRWQEIPELAHIAVLSRPGTRPGTLPAWAKARVAEDHSVLQRTPAGRLVFLDVSPQDISGSRIRTVLAQGGSVAGMLPEAVLEYIQANHLYIRSK
jgi:nicotinate-nucleotide adenylyltransferase